MRSRTICNCGLNERSMRRFGIAPRILAVGWASISLGSAATRVDAQRAADPAHADCAPRSVMRLLPPTPSRPDTAAYPTCAVDRPADMEIRPPGYPALLRRGEIEGSVVVEFVVDTLGLVVQSSVRELSTTHALFSAAAVNAVRQWKGKPAVLGRNVVRSRAEYRFVFSVHCYDERPRPTASFAVVCG